MRNPFDKILNWYFTKNSLPYWSIFLSDCFVLALSGILVYWAFHDANLLVVNLLPLLCTVGCFIVLSIPGFKIFHTYSGFMRYSSFVDLMRVVYSNALGLVLSLIAQLGMDHLPTTLFVHFDATKIILLFVMATMLMWALRVFVKTLYDVAFSNANAQRVLI